MSRSLRLRSRAGCGARSISSWANSVYWRPNFDCGIHNFRRRRRFAHRVVIIREDLKHGDAQNILDLFRGKDRILRNPVQDHGDAAVQLQRLQKSDLFAGQMQGRGFRRAHHQHALGFSNQFQGVALQITRQVDAGHVVVAPPEMNQSVEMFFVDPHVRIEPTGVHHVELAD